MASQQVRKPELERRRRASKLEGIEVVELAGKGVVGAREELKAQRGAAREVGVVVEIG
jgi:hypothetical protein